MFAICLNAGSAQVALPLILLQVIKTLLKLILTLKSLLDRAKTKLEEMANIPAQADAAHPEYADIGVQYESPIFQMNEEQ